MDHTEKNLWYNYWHSSDNLQVVNYYLPIVKQIASNAYSQHSDIARMEDLKTAGIFGMMDAIKGYSPKSTIDFKDYCEIVIKCKRRGKTTAPKPCPSLSKPVHSPTSPSGNSASGR